MAQATGQSPLDTDAVLRVVDAREYACHDMCGCARFLGYFDIPRQPGYRAMKERAPEIPVDLVRNVAEQRRFSHAKRATDALVRPHPASPAAGIGPAVAKHRRAQLLDLQLTQLRCKDTPVQ